MKLNLMYIISIIIVFGCNTSKNSKKIISQNYFKVEILQDNKIVKSKKGLIVLDKKPFKFKVDLYKTDGIDVSASWDKYYYDYPDEKNIYECIDDRHFKDCRFVAIKTGNQDKFNVDKDLAVGDGDYQWHWFYNKDKDWHRFDEKVVVKEGVIYASMTVENIYDCDLRDSREASESQYDYPIEKIDKDIYLVFAASEWEPGKQTKELQREKIIIKFREK